MLHILLLILKIMGITLLVILAILIIALGMVLFVPAKYVIEGKSSGSIHELSFEAKAQWVFRLFFAYYVYVDGKSDWQVRFGWNKWHLPDAKKSKSKKEKPADMEEMWREDSVFEDSENSIDSKPHFKSRKQKKQNIFDKIKCTILKICAKIKSAWVKKTKITEFLTDEIHVDAFHIVKHEIMQLSKHWHPRRIHGRVQFGFEDPYHTGQVLAVLSMLYPLYGDNVEIVPDFEQSVLSGDLYAKGHIRLWHLLMAIKVLFFNKKVRKTYKDFNKIKG